MIRAAHVRKQHMNTATKVARSSGNIFEDIGLPNSEQHEIKAKIVSFLALLIERKRLPQSAVAARTGIAQPDLSKLLRGQFSGFSLDRLLSAVAAMGTDYEIKLKKPARDRRGHGTVLAPLHVLQKAKQKNG
jgi:predicted XRE-type DNA-binding protein